MKLAVRRRQALTLSRRWQARLRQTLSLNPDEQAAILLIVSLWLVGMAVRAFFALS